MRRLCLMEKKLREKYQTTTTTPTRRDVDSIGVSERPFAPKTPSQTPRTDSSEKSLLDDRVSFTRVLLTSLKKTIDANDNGDKGRSKKTNLNWFR